MLANIITSNDTNNIPNISNVSNISHVSNNNATLTDSNTSQKSYTNNIIISTPRIGSITPQSMSQTMSQTQLRPNPLKRTKSIREMISEIEIRAKNNLACPDYVTTLDKLDRDMLTWQKSAFSTDDKESVQGPRFVICSHVLCFFSVFFFKCIL